jgi:hypothetical protein
MSQHRRVRDFGTDPKANLFQAAIPGGRGIEASEARGQVELVNSTQLPFQGSDDPALAAAGVVVGGETNGNDMRNAGKPLFIDATLPAGWKKVGTDHDMWSKLVDEKGRTRATMFYKAAFYDQSAFMGTVGRFNIQRKYIEGNDNTYVLEVRDCEEPIFSVTRELPGKQKERTREQWSECDAIEKEAAAVCEKWLVDQGYPEWKDHSKYWD